MKDADRAQQLQFNTAQELYEAVCAGQAATEKAAVERHCIRLQKTVGRFYTTSLTSTWVSRPVWRRWCSFPSCLAHVRLPERGTFSDETVNSVRVSKVQAGMLSEVQDMMEHLMKFVEAAVLRETMRRVKFAELVADFTLDEDSRWWLLQVKAFRLQAPFASLPKQPTPVWVNGLGENGSKVRLASRCAFLIMPPDVTNSCVGSLPSPDIQTLPGVWPENFGWRMRTDSRSFGLLPDSQVPRCKAPADRVGDDFSFEIYVRPSLRPAEAV